MFGFGEERYWRNRKLFKELGGVDVEEPPEDLEQTYEEAVEEVETFTGREFVETPRLRVVSDDSRRDLFEDGVYFPNTNTVVFNEENMNSAEHSQDHEFEPMNVMSRQLESMTPKDVLLEELVHGMQDQQMGVTQYDHGPRETVSGWFESEDKPEQPDFLTEGFADYVTDYLGNKSIELTEASVRVSAAQKQRAEERGLLSKMLDRQSGKLADASLEHTAERYLGHLYFKAIEQEEGVEGVMERAFDNTPGYDDLNEVIETVEYSDIDRDEEVYVFSRDYLWSQKGPSS
jgi:hypothetical protein